jgi:hypothetical protein
MATDSSGNEMVTTSAASLTGLGTKIAGEDLTNDVLKVREAATYTNISASTLIKTGAGIVKGIIINSHTTGTIKLWDNTSAATTVILETISLNVGERSIPMDAGIEFSTGLYVTIGGTANVTILWK